MAELRFGAEGTPEAFRESMAHLVSGVAVVTAGDPAGRPCGLLVSSITSYGTDPASVLLAIGCSARTYRALEQAERFGVHLLASDQLYLAEVFAGHDENKFADIDWQWDGHVPRISGAMSYLKCRTVMFTPLSDHAIVVGEVTSLDEVTDNDPLVYYKRRLDWHLNSTGGTKRATPPPGRDTR
ncbi:flavin reductase family protein [Streptomyces sp. NPDC050738]|uniref:flavin reductase family protein n=1 Tax=Streptomyces sp. NPDC050738 TaxID=3154744 RepID=UPI0034314249